MFGKLHAWIEKLLFYERSAHKFALACAMGVYVAFSPFIGLHTAMVLILSWVFALNFTIMLTVSWAINNPWTMVPVYGVGYVFGDWFLNLFGINHSFNPAWLTEWNTWLAQKIELQNFSFWGFLVGGNILGVGLAFIVYPLMKRYATIVMVNTDKQLERSKAAATQLVFTAARALEQGKEKVIHVYANFIINKTQRPQA